MIRNTWRLGRLKPGDALLLLLLLFTSPVSANHLTGYDWLLQPLGGDQYRLTLRLYTDGNAQNAPLDQVLTVATFAQRPSSGGGSGLIETFALPLIGDGTVATTGPVCPGQATPIRALTYTAEVLLSAGRYTDPGGYYLAWERCCRNEALTNVANPTRVGLAAVLTFPPLRLNGAAQPYTSPVFRAPPPGAAWCVGAPARLSFNALTPPDADSLVYALVPALAGFTTSSASQLPIPNAGPYPPVTYRPGFGAARPLPGAFVLNARTGELRGVPEQLGAYVVAVTATVYRNGQVRGQSRRELEVRVANCPANVRPSLVRADGRPATDTLFITDAVSRCLPLRVFDADGGQLLTFGAAGAPVQFSATTLVADPAIAQTVTICWTQCAAPARQILRLWVRDDACTGAATSDTLRIPVVVRPLPNQSPRLALATGLPTDTLQVQAGEELTLALTATDPDGGPLTLTARLDGALPPAALTITPAAGPAPLPATLRWTPACADARTAHYVLTVRVNDGGCLAGQDSVRQLVRVRAGGAASATSLFNIITPNGDGRNDCFRLPDALRVPGTGCGGGFRRITICNRWGRTVFQSTDPTFCWEGPNGGSGTFFCLLDFGNTILRGLLTVVK